MSISAFTEDAARPAPITPLRARPGRATDVLSRDEIKSFTRASNFAGARAVLLNWTIIAGTFALLARFPHPATLIVAVIILGGRQLALAVMMHDAAHGTLFKNRFMNDVVVDLLCARPVWGDVPRYRKHHLKHHAHTGTELDPDLGLAAPFPITRASLARKLFRDISGISGLKRVVGQLGMDVGLLTYDVGAGPKRLPRQSIGHHLKAGLRQTTPTILTNIALFSILALLGHAWLYAAWVAAFLTTYGLFLRIRSFAEHACMIPGSADPFENTRTTRAGILERLTISPLNVGFHLEHHLLPTVPYHLLPALHRRLEEKDALPKPAVASGYLEVVKIVTDHGRRKSQSDDHS